MTTAMDEMIGDVVQTYKDLARFWLTLRTIYVSHIIWLIQRNLIIWETDKGLWDNTILIFSSDNGGKSKEGFSKVSKRTVWPLNQTVIYEILKRKVDTIHHSELRKEVCTKVGLNRLVLLIHHFSQGKPWSMDTNSVQGI